MDEMKGATMCRTRLLRSLLIGSGVTLCLVGKAPDIAQAAEPFGYVSAADKARAAQAAPAAPKLVPFHAVVKPSETTPPVFIIPFDAPLVDITFEASGTADF